MVKAEAYEVTVRREIIETVLVKVRGDSPVESLDLIERAVQDPTDIPPYVSAYLVENREYVGDADVIDIEPIKDFHGKQDA